MLGDAPHHELANEAAEIGGHEHRFKALNPLFWRRGPGLAPWGRNVTSMEPPNARGRGESTQPMQPARSIQLVAEGEAGAVYHDVSDVEWVVDLTMRGVTLTFDHEEFKDLVRLAEEASRYVTPERRAASPHKKVA